MTLQHHFVLVSNRESRLKYFGHPFLTHGNYRNYGQLILAKLLWNMVIDLKTYLILKNTKQYSIVSILCNIIVKFKFQRLKLFLLQTSILVNLNSISTINTWDFKDDLNQIT